MAELDFSPQSNLAWGSETSEGARVASEVERERRDGSAGSAELRSKPEKRSVPTKAVSGSNSVLSCLGGAELPANAVVLARSLDVRQVSLQAELLWVSNQITLCSQGHADVVMSSSEQPQSDAQLTVAAKVARVEVFKDSLLSQRDDIMRKLAASSSGAEKANVPDESDVDKFTRQLPIPHLEYPKHNFVGWLMGTGCKSKHELERRTGAKVQVRGVGAVPEPSNEVSAAVEDDLHVAVSAGTQNAVDYACELLQPLLDPKHAMHATAAGNFLAHVMSGQRSSYTAPVDGGLPRATSAAAAAAALASAAAMTDQHSTQHSQHTTYPAAASLTNDPSLPGPPPPGGATIYGTAHQTFHPTAGGGVVDPHCKLFVGHLPNSVTDSMLHGLFSHYGHVKQAEVMKHRDSGATRGFGFVHMETREQAATAIASLNGYRVEGRTLQVSVKGARRDQRPPSTTWSAPQAIGSSYQHHLMVPDDLPPGVDPFELPHSVVMPIYAWDSSYACGMHTIKTPIGVREAPEETQLQVPSYSSYTRKCFAQPFSGFEVADAAGMSRPVYGVWSRAHEEHDPDEVPPGMAKAPLSKTNSIEVSNLGPNGEALDAPVHSIPVSLSAKEKKRVEHREATQEARTAAGEERRQRLLAAAAASVKQSAPPASQRPPKQQSKSSSAPKSGSRDASAAAPKRRSPAAAVHPAQTNGSMQRQGSGSVQRSGLPTARGRESAENESGTGNKRDVHSMYTSTAAAGVNGTSDKRSRRDPNRKTPVPAASCEASPVAGQEPPHNIEEHRRSGGSEKDGHRTHRGGGYDERKGQEHRTVGSTAPRGGGRGAEEHNGSKRCSRSRNLKHGNGHGRAGGTSGVPEGCKSVLEGSGRSRSADDKAAEPSESGEILDSDADDDTASGAAPLLATEGGAADAAQLPFHSGVSASSGGLGSVHGSNTPRSARSGNAPGHSSRPTPGVRPMHGSHDWERDRDPARDRDKYYEDIRVSTRNAGYGGMRGVSEYKDEGGYAAGARRGFEGALVSPPGAHPHAMDRGNIRDGMPFAKDREDLRWQRDMRYEHKPVDRFNGERWGTAHAHMHDGPSASPPGGPGMKGGCRGTPTGSVVVPPLMHDSYPPEEWERGRRGPPPLPLAGVPMGPLMSPGMPLRRDWSMERAAPPGGGGVDGGSWDRRAGPRPMGRF